jgi:hypothetical protein
MAKASMHRLASEESKQSRNNNAKINIQKWKIPCPRMKRSEATAFWKILLEDY